MNNPQIFRPKSGYIFAGMAFWIVATMLYLQIIDYGFNLGLIIASIWGALVCLIGYQIFIHPKVVFYDEGVEIVNPFTHHLIGWQDVEQIDTRYTMSIKTNGGGVGTKQIYAFAAPAPGRYHSRSIHQSEYEEFQLFENQLCKPDLMQSSALGKSKLPHGHETFEVVILQPQSFHFP